MRLRWPLTTTRTIHRLAPDGSTARCSPISIAVTPGTEGIDETFGELAADHLGFLMYHTSSHKVKQMHGIRR